MSLLECPNEVIEGLAKICEQTSLAVLARVNRRLHSIVTPFLYEAPKFRLPANLTSFANDGVLRYGPLVHTLDFSTLTYRWNDLTDPVLLRILAHCPNVVRIDVDSANIRERGFRAIADTLGPRLLALGASDSYIQDADLHHLLTRAPLLQKLDLSISDVTNLGIRAIADHAPNLQWLSLRDCPTIKDASLRYLKQKCTRLRHLDIDKCGLHESGISEWDWETDGVFTGDEEDEGALDSAFAAEEVTDSSDEEEAAADAAELPDEGYPDVPFPPQNDGWGLNGPGWNLPGAQIIQAATAAATAASAPHLSVPTEDDEWETDDEEPSDIPVA